MSETVKLIVTLSKGQYEALKDIQFGGIGSRMIFNAVKNGVPLDDVKKEIETNLSWDMFDENGNKTRLHKELMDILDSIGKETK